MPDGAWDSLIDSWDDLDAAWDEAGGVVVSVPSGPLSAFERSGIIGNPRAGIIAKDRSGLTASAR